MEINTKDELLTVIDDLQSRLALVEDKYTKEEPKDEPAEQTASEESAEVESEDEIEKLLG